MTTLPVAWWMHTRVGRWLACHTSLFASLWHRAMLKAIHDEADEIYERCQIDLMVAADLYVQSFSADPVVRKRAEGRLVSAVCAFRNAKGRWVQTLGQLEGGR